MARATATSQRTEHTMQPGDVLLIGDEAWTYDELIGQLSLARCPHLRAVSEHRIGEARAMHGFGVSTAVIAQRLGVSTRTVNRYLEPDEVRDKRRRRATRLHALRRRRAA